VNQDVRTMKLAKHSSPIRVLLVDDDDDLRALIRQGFEEIGWEVQEAASGLDLVNALANGKEFNVVVSDIQMPWLSGLQAATAVRRNGGIVPFVLMSALKGEEVHTTVAALSHSVFLQKPFELSTLVKAVTVALVP